MKKSGYKEGRLRRREIVGRQEEETNNKKKKKQLTMFYNLTPRAL